MTEAFCNELGMSPGDAAVAASAVVRREHRGQADYGAGPPRADRGVDRDLAPPSPRLRAVSTSVLRPRRSHGPWLAPRGRPAPTSQSRGPRKVPLRRRPPAGLGRRLMAQLGAELERMSPTQRLIVDGRLYRSSPTTLGQLARECEVSREWVRLLEKRLRNSLEEAADQPARLLVSAIAEIVGPVTTDAELENQILSALDVDPRHPPTADHRPLGPAADHPGNLPMADQTSSATAAELTSSPLGADQTSSATAAELTSNAPAAELARRMIRTRLDYSCLDGICLSQEALGVTRRLRQAATTLADDAGLIDEEALLACLPGPEWLEHVPALVRRSGLHRVVGRLALRASNRARAKAALMSLGKPSTKAEIAAVAGLSPQRVGACLSSMASVARAGKLRWGLAEWVDHAYEGLAAEIALQINSDGGETSLLRLAEELPRRFEVSASSVRTYVSSPKFVLDDGRVRLRRPNEPFVFNRAGVRGCPATFALGPRRVGFFFVVDREVIRGSGRPLPIAAAAIIGLTVNTIMCFHGPAQTAVKVTWPDTSPAGPSLGSTRGLAATVGAKEGDLLSVVIDGNNATIAATATDPADHPPGWPLVARLTGIDERDGLHGLARALECSPGAARSVLRARGDALILEALPDGEGLSVLGPR